MGLEKGLVELLHYHNNDCYRSQNGWSTEAWNRIVKLFQEKFPYVSFTKMQIQDKEKELKRDFNLLKEAKKQSGAHWDETLGMIHADPPVWDNIITVTCLCMPIAAAILSLALINFNFPVFLFSTVLPESSEIPNQAFPPFSDSVGVV
jgi:hypothetical protein